MKKRKLRVGIFDSGIGGLTVLWECIRQMPDVKYYYYGDNGRAPYGTKSTDEIYAFTREAFLRLERCRVDAAVIACNTATAAAIHRIRGEFSFPVLGVEPAVKRAGKACGNVLVLATPYTAQSARLKLLVNAEQDCSFTVHACPRLAPAIEGALTRGDPILLASHLPRGSFDGVVLGCTHFVFFSKEISSFYACPVFDGNEGVAKRLSKLLKYEKLGTTDHRYPQTTTNKCFTKSQKLSVKFLGKSRVINKFVFYEHLFHKFL